MQLSMTRDPLLFGIGALGLAGFLAYLNLPYLTDGVHAEGVVVDVVERPARRGKTYHPVVRFHDGDETLTFKSNVGTGTNSYQIGETVPVLYLPDEPDKATIDKFSHLWLGPILLGCVGLFGLLVSLMGSLQSRIPSQRQLYRQALYGWKPEQ
jgi:hypothetical protein